MAIQDYKCGCFEWFEEDKKTGKPQVWIKHYCKQHYPAKKEKVTVKPIYTWLNTQTKK